MKNSRWANLVLYSNPAIPSLIVSKNPPPLILVLYFPLTMSLLIVSKNSRYADFSACYILVQSLQGYIDGSLLLTCNWHT